MLGLRARKKKAKESVIVARRLEHRLLGRNVPMSVPAYAELQVFTREIGDHISEKFGPGPIADDLMDTLAAEFEVESQNFVDKFDLSGGESSVFLYGWPSQPM